MTRPILSLALAILCSLPFAWGDTLDVKNFLISKPYKLNSPAMLDSTDVKGKPFDALAFPATGSPMAQTAEAFSGAVLPAVEAASLQVLSFQIDNSSYAKVNVNVGGEAPHAVWIDGKRAEGETTLLPATHTVAVGYLSLPGAIDSVKVNLTGQGVATLDVRTEGARRLTLHDVLDGRRIVSVGVSPSGKYLLTTYSVTEFGGTTSRRQTVTDTSTGAVVCHTSGQTGWLPGSDELFSVVGPAESRRIEAMEVPSMAVRTVATGLPEGHFVFSPAGDALIFTVSESADAEKDHQVYEIVNPEDRQPGYRDRNRLFKYDIATGVITPLTFGHHDTTLSGMSADGKKMLVKTSRQRFEKRPTTVFDLWLIDLATMDTRRLVDGEGFLGEASLSPDALTVAAIASPEAFGGIGKNLPDGRIPSMYDYQLYAISTADGSVRPLTRDFDPAVTSMEWSRWDGMLYFTAENRDRIDLYRVDPHTGHITPMNAREENVAAFSTAAKAPLLAYSGQGASNSDRLYTLDTEKLRHRMVHDLSAERLDGIRLGECSQWDYVNSRGDTVCARYILPPDFDPSKKYPMIVNYYGGCSPTSRAFETRYPHHLYAANGYVVLVINPSGAAGFGQEWASRHVNTAGEGVAQDIIDGTVQFAETHPWVDSSKIGCIGASYGGFMTQYLQTVTDIFAAAISHAGISDHTSYWGEGYWGYSYSEVSMAGSYPWSDRSLYVDQSPLYRADKIHTPLLFLHGDHDTNVPYGESIQMFTALKLLGRPTALVAVKDANHQILEYDKRLKWQDTIFAWFARYLKDDPTWWNELYPEKNLE